MTIKKKPSAADLLNRQINSTKRKADPPINDPFAQAVAKRLESRGIAEVPGLPNNPPEVDGFDVLIELHRRNREFQAQRQAQRQAEDEVAKRPPTAAGLLAEAIAAQGNTNVPSKHMPLNGAAILRAALAGGAGTINSEIGQAYE